MTAAAQTPVPVLIGRPEPGDAGACWELVKATGVLDVNSRYAYALWFRDFAATSVIARTDGGTAGFVSGYRRPDEPPTTLVIWQVAVGEAARGRGVAGSMRDLLWARVPGVDHLETTITGQRGSVALFTAFAKRHSASVRRRVRPGRTRRRTPSRGPVPNRTRKTQVTTRG